MNEPSELDLAQLRHEMRSLYKSVGPEECYQVLYELLKSAEILIEIMIEESNGKIKS